MVLPVTDSEMLMLTVWSQNSIVSAVTYSCFMRWKLYIRLSWINIWAAADMQHFDTSRNFTFDMFFCSFLPVFAALSEGWVCYYFKMTTGILHSSSQLFGDVGGCRVSAWAPGGPRLVTTSGRSQRWRSLCVYLPGFTCRHHQHSTTDSLLSPEQAAVGGFAKCVDEHASFSLVCLFILHLFQLAQTVCACEYTTP